MWVEMSYFLTQYQALKEDANLTVTVVHVWETQCLPPGHGTDGTQDVPCAALSLTHSLDYIPELKRGDGDG